MARGYNQFRYNTKRYNADGNELNFSESVGSADTLTEVDYKLLTELLVMNDDLTNQVTDKVLSDTLRLSDWLSIRRNPLNNQWFD